MIFLELDTFDAYDMLLLDESVQVLLGNVVISKKFLRTRKIMVMI